MSALEDRRSYTRSKGPRVWLLGHPPTLRHCWLGHDHAVCGGCGFSLLSLGLFKAYHGYSTRSTTHIEYSVLTLSTDKHGPLSGSTVGPMHMATSHGANMKNDGLFPKSRVEKQVEICLLKTAVFSAGKSLYSNEYRDHGGYASRQQVSTWCQ